MSQILGVIDVQFDPLLRVGALTVRWETVGVTVALLLALGVAALLAQSTLADMLLIVAGAVPGAVVGGRIVHALDYWSVYSAAPLTILDPAVGTLSLLGAVLGGMASAAYVARLIRAPLPQWADKAAVPLLLVLGLGKLAQLLGGSGQGLPFDGPWSVAFLGDGPWVSASPGIASQPSQVYEGLWLLIGIPLVLWLSGPRRSPARVDRLVAWADRAAAEGRLFLFALTWFLVGRVLVGFTWRDPPAIGPLNMEQALALGALGATWLSVLVRHPRYLGLLQPKRQERAP